MPDLVTKICGAPACFKIVRDDYCKEHKKARRQRDNARRGAKNSSTYGYRWQNYSRKYLRRHPLCARGRELGLAVPCVATVVDHKIPIELGGAMWDPDNHQALCAHHHNGWKQKQDNELRKQMAGSGDAHKSDE